MYLNRFLKDLFYLILIVVLCLAFSILDQSAFIIPAAVYKLSLVVIIIYLALALLCIESFGIKSVDLSKRIGIIYILLMPFRFYQFTFVNHIAYQGMPLSYMLRITSIAIFIEVILLMRCFKSAKKATTYTKEIYRSVFIFIALAVGNHLFLSLLNSKQNFVIFYSVINLAALIISIYLVQIVRKMKNSFSQELYYNLFMFALFFMLHKFFVFNIDNSYTTTFLSFRLIFNLMYSYFLFKFVKLRIRTITIKDLTDELKWSEKKLQQSLQDIKDLLYLLPEAAFMCKEDTIVFVNKKFLEMFHIKEGKEVIGKKLYDLLPAELYLQFKKYTEKYMPLEMPISSDFSFSIDNFSYDLEISTTFLNYKGIASKLSLLRDLSDKKQRAKLSAALIKKDYDEQLKNEFLSMISHEFKTPVNVIYSALQLQKMNIEDGNLSGLDKSTAVIKQNCHRLMRLTGNLLDITTLEAGHLKACFKRYNIVPLIENIYLALKNFITKYNIIIHFDTDENEIYVKTDYLFLERILLNILSNSVKYSKPAGNIFISLKVAEHQVLISIKDDGIGLPADKSDLIFNRFSRIDNTLSREQEGSGLGLYLVKGLTELLRGTVMLSSIEHIGTEVTLSFTLSDATYSSEDLPLNLMTDTVSLSDKINIEFSDIYL